MTKHLKRRHLLIVIVALSLLSVNPVAGSTGQGNAETAQQVKDVALGDVVTVDKTDMQIPAIVGELAPVAAVSKALENEQYELYLNEATGNVRIVDKRTGTELLGEPQLSKTALPNEKKFVESPVHFKYTEGVDVTSTYSLKDKENKFTIRKQEDAVRVDFDFTKQKLALAIEYRLTSKGLEVTIPEDSIKEDGVARLISIEPLPFLNAGKETDEGAMLLPDGSGALLEFRQNHPKYLRGYSEPIYGPDLAFLTQSHSEVYEIWLRKDPPREKIALPVFGMYRNGVASLGIVTKGEAEARINGTPAGVRNINLYRNSVEFVYRKDDVIFIGTSGKIPYYQGIRIPGDRKVQYVLLEAMQANYVGMAQAYRRYLTEEAGVKPVTGTQPTLQVSLLGGVRQDEVIGSSFVKMTTFEQVREIIDQYAARGVSDLELTLDGWSHDGIYGDQPDHYPVEKKLGGSDKLKELAAYAKTQGIALYLKANYVRPYSDSDGMKAKKDAIVGMDRNVLKVFNYYVSDGWNKREEVFYLLKPERVLEKHIMKESESFAELGVSGVQLKYMGDTTYSDLDPQSFTSKQDTVKVWIKAMDEIKLKIGSTAVDYGFAYSLGHVDRIDGAPLDSSHFVYTDTTVPFYEIALHGLVPYTAQPFNLADDSRMEWLRMLEYGALPSFELTADPTSKLQRTMESRLFSSEASNWVDVSANMYHEVKGLYESIEGVSISNHEELQPNVFRTSYVNGVSITVNYNKYDVSTSGLTVQEYGYTMEGGEAE